MDRLARRVALASMIVSALLAAVKISVGLMASSTAVFSDGIESAGDVLASGLVLMGLIVAAKPPDEDHPYGHGRFETLTALGVGVLLVASGTLICYGSLDRAYHPHASVEAYAMWPMFASIAVKTGSWAAKRYYGRKIGSTALTADSWHDAVDILSGVTALAAVGLALWRPETLGGADHAGGFLVGLIVIFLGVRVAHDTTLQLMDTMPGPAMMAQVRSAALGVPGALGVEKCFARRTGLKYHVDLHLEVDPSMTVHDSHDIATQVRNRIREELDWVADVLVHVEPSPAATIGYPGRTHGKP